MPAPRLSMRKIREVLRLKHERGLSHRAVAQACAIGVGTVARYLQQAKRKSRVQISCDTWDTALDLRARAVAEMGRGRTVAHAMISPPMGLAPGYFATDSSKDACISSRTSTTWSSRAARI